MSLPLVAVKINGFDAMLKMILVTAVDKRPWNLDKGLSSFHFKNNHSSPLVMNKIF